MPRRLPTFAFGLVALTACASEAASVGDEAFAPALRSAESGEDVGQVSSAIIAGEPSTKSQDSVVMVAFFGNGVSGGCTGTLLAPNLVLTARHCVSLPSDGAFGCDANGNLVPGSEGGRLVSDFQPSQLYVFKGVIPPNFQAGKVTADARGKTILHPDKDTVCSNDIALIVLNQPVLDVPIAPVRLEGGVKPGDKLVAVGYGLTEDGVEAAERLQRSDIAVLRVGPQSGSARQAPVSPNVFEVGEAICQGDSGGPAFDAETGAVVGVVSAGGNGTTDAKNPAAGCIGAATRNYYTSTTAFKSLILEGFEEAGAKPWLEGELDPRLAKTGNICSSNTECQGGLCVQGPNTKVCSQTCGETSDCPSGFSCGDKGGQRLCLAGNGGGGCSAGGAPSSPTANFAVGIVVALTALLTRRRR